MAPPNPLELLKQALATAAKGDVAATKADFDKAMKAAEFGDGGTLDHVMHAYATYLRSQREFPKALQLQRMRLDMRRLAGRDRPGLIVDALLDLAITLRGAGENLEAEALLHEAIGLAESSPMPSALLANALIYLSMHHQERQDFAKELALLERAVKAREADADCPPAELALTRDQAAKACLRTKDFARARALLALALPVLDAVPQLAGDPNIPQGWLALATLCAEQGDLPAASRHARQAFERARTLAGKLPQAPQEFHTFVLQTAHQAATYAAMERRPEDAAQLTWEAHEYAKANFAGNPLPALETLQIHLNFIIGAGEFAKAEPLMRQVVAGKMMLLGEDHLDLSAPLNNLGYVLMNLGKDAEAENCFRKSWAACMRAPATEHNGHALKNLGLLYQKQGKAAEAAAEFKAALAVLEPQLGAEHPVVKMVRAGTQG
jgi:tetratricopeptide (TPR) repeat protein